MILQVDQTGPTLLEIVNQIGGLLGIGGILLVIVKSIIDRRKRSAENEVISAQAEGLEIDNDGKIMSYWERTAARLEKEIERIKSENEEMRAKMLEMDNEIRHLKHFDDENKRLHKEIEQCQKARIDDQKKYQNELKRKENVIQELRDNIAVLEAELKARKSPDG